MEIVHDDIRHLHQQQSYQPQPLHATTWRSGKNALRSVHPAPDSRTSRGSSGTIRRHRVKSKTTLQTTPHGTNAKSPYWQTTSKPPCTKPASAGESATSRRRSTRRLPTGTASHTGTKQWQRHWSATADSDGPAREPTDSPNGTSACRTRPRHRARGTPSPLKSTT